MQKMHVYSVITARRAVRSFAKHALSSFLFIRSVINCSRVFDAYLRGYTRTKQNVNQSKTAKAMNSAGVHARTEKLQTFGSRLS